MSWEPLGVSRATEGAAALISTTRGAGRLPPFLVITLRKDKLPALDFVRKGGTCQVLFGRGEHAGGLRVVPGSTSSFFALGRLASQGASLSIRVKLPDGITPAKRAPEAVQIKCDGDELELRLPGWAVAVERVTVPAPAARASIMDRVPDPATALRGGARR